MQTRYQLKMPDFQGFGPRLAWIQPLGARFVDLQAFPGFESAKIGILSAYFFTVGY